MPLILDTYNIIHAGIAMGGAMGDLNVRKLCLWLRSAPGRQKTTLVLDGRPKPDEPSPNEFPELHFVYSGAGVSADDVIEQLVERSAHRKKVLVVTNDRAVQAAARRLGAQPQSCETFLATLMTAHSTAKAAARQTLPAAKTSGTATKGETDHWMREFGLKDGPPAEKKSKPAGEDDLDMKKLMGF